MCARTRRWGALAITPPFEASPAAVPAPARHAFVALLATVGRGALGPAVLGEGALAFTLIHLRRALDARSPLLGRGAPAFTPPEEGALAITLAAARRARGTYSAAARRGALAFTPPLEGALALTLTPWGPAYSPGSVARWR